MGGSGSKRKKPTNMTGHPAERPSDIILDEKNKVYRTTVSGEAAGSAAETSSVATALHPEARQKAAQHAHEAVAQSSRYMSPENLKQAFKRALIAFEKTYPRSKALARLNAWRDKYDPSNTDLISFIRGLLRLHYTDSRYNNFVAHFLCPELRKNPTSLVSQLKGLQATYTKENNKASPSQVVAEKAVLPRGEAGTESTTKEYQLVQTYLQRGSSGEAADKTKSSLTDLLRELIEEGVAPYLPLKDAANLRLTNHFFSECPRISHPLLMHVALGRQTAAEEMIKKDLALYAAGKKSIEDLLIFTHGRAFDHVRYFGRISPVKYALWARDRHMWAMIMRCIETCTDDIDKINALKETVLDHLEALERDGTEHGPHYDFQALNTAYAELGVAYNVAPINWKAVEKCWEKLGIVQGEVPLHVANEYCRRDRSFDPTPSFDESDLPRTTWVYDSVSGKWVNWSEAGGVWARGGMRGGSYASLSAPGWRRTWEGVGRGRLDSIAISSLCKVRTKEFNQLKAELQTLRSSLQSGAPASAQPGAS